MGGQSDGSALWTDVVGGHAPPPSTSGCTTLKLIEQKQFPPLHEQLSGTGFDMFSVQAAGHGAVTVRSVGHAVWKESAGVDTAAIAAYEAPFGRYGHVTLLFIHGVVTHGCAH